MPELTFKSAGVSAREIDLSGPTGISPSGTPAGIIGTALRGPAFVPVEMARLADFVAKNTVVVGCSIDSKFSHWAWLNTPKNNGGIQV